MLHALRTSHLTFLIGLFIIGCSVPEEIEVSISTPEEAAQFETTQQKIRYGQDDGDTHPSIVKLIMQVGNSYYLCSGSVIESRTILTAAHCVDQVSDASAVRVIYNGETQRASEVHIHEQYSASAQHVRYFEGDYYRFSGPDIAVLRVPNPLNLPLVSIGAPPTNRGTELTIVGYGNNESLNSGVRRNGVVEFVALSPTYRADRSVVDAEQGSVLVDPGSSNQTVCGGDSGGALLYQGELVGVTSGGVINHGSENQCVLSRNANFISPIAYQGWISQYVTLPTAEEPEQPKEAPEETPEQPEEAPEETPEQPEETPEQPEETPEQPEETPEQPEETPEQPEETPEQPEETPEQPEEAPEQPEEAPEQPTEPFVAEYGQVDITSEWMTVELQQTYVQPVIIISDLQDHSQGAATARISDVTSDSFNVRLQSPRYPQYSESRSSTVSYLVVEAGTWVLPNGDTIEAGTLQSNKLFSQGWEQVSLSTAKHTPVVLTQVQSFAGEDWVITRVRNQSNRGFQVTMQEEERLSRTGHTHESIGWVSLPRSLLAHGDSFEAFTTPRMVNHHTRRLRLSSALDTATVFVKLASFYGPDVATVALGDRTEDQLNVRVAEERSRDREVRHTQEQVSALIFPDTFGVIEAEEYVDEGILPMGEYGQITLSTNWQQVDLQGQYEQPVVIFSDPTTPDQDAIVVRLRNITDRSFEARLQLPSYLTGTYRNQVSFMVIEAGEWVLDNGVHVSAGLTEINQLSTQGWSRVNAHFERRPTLLTQIQSTNDEAWVLSRVRGLRNNGFQLTMQEEERTQRTGHGAETIGWVMIEQGSFIIDNQAALSMQTGRAIDHRARRVSYSNPLNTMPSVIAKLGSTYGIDSANVSVSDATSDGFTVRVAEERSRDRETRHTAEELSLLILPGSAGQLRGER